MKITKAMGMACLRRLASIEVGKPCRATTVVASMAAFHEAFEDKWEFQYQQDDPVRLTALAMCAAIAGVKP